MIQDKQKWIIIKKLTGNFFSQLLLTVYNYFQSVYSQEKWREYSKNRILLTVVNLNLDTNLSSIPKAQKQKKIGKLGELSTLAEVDPAFHIDNLSLSVVKFESI